MPLCKTVIIPPFYKTSSWFVYNPQGRAPTYPHQSKTSAENEAKRLAGLNKSQEFYLVQLAGAVYDVHKGFRNDSVTETDPVFRVGEKYKTSRGETVTILSTTSRAKPGFPILAEGEDGFLYGFTLAGLNSVERLQYNNITKEKMTVLIPQEGLLRIF